MEPNRSNPRSALQGHAWRSETHRWHALDRKMRGCLIEYRHPGDRLWHRLYLVALLTLWCARPREWQCAPRFRRAFGSVATAQKNSNSLYQGIRSLVLSTHQTAERLGCISKPATLDGLRRYHFAVPQGAFSSCAPKNLSLISDDLGTRWQMARIERSKLGGDTLQDASDQVMDCLGCALGKG